METKARRANETRPSAQARSRDEGEIGHSRHCHHSTNPLDGGGARAVPGSQRGGSSEADGENRWATRLRAWVLRARDGSRSGGSAEMRPALRQVNYLSFPPCQFRYRVRACLRLWLLLIVERQR